MENSLNPSPTESPHGQPAGWLDRPLLDVLQLDVEKALYVLLILAAFFTRFYNLGERAMSHDESLHTYYSWNLYAGRGFAHTPLMHGPFLFHINALIYALFGADDFTARISAALFGVILVGLPWLLRRWLGRSGALASALMLLISPSIMYYARYIRNESYVTVWALLSVWAIFSYLRKQDGRWLYVLAGASILCFASKEVAFIYTAIFGTCLVLLLAWQLVHYNKLGLNGLAGILAGAAGGALVLAIGLLLQYTALNATGLGTTGTIAVDGIPKVTGELDMAINAVVAQLLLLGGIGAAAGVAVYFWLRFLMPEPARVTGEGQCSALDLLIVLGTLYLPALSPFAMYVMKIDPMDYSAAGVVRAGGVFLLFLAISIAVGLWWNAWRWSISAGVWYGIGITLFTTVFTNGAGLASGFVGSLGYWLAQQGVQRGSQPTYYYLLIMPLYEYMPMLVSLVATGYYLVKGRLPDQGQAPGEPFAASKTSFVFFLVYWIATTWLLYSYAGEKMPWLIVHFALPTILLAGLFLGQVVESIRWRSLGLAWLAGLLVPLLVVGLGSIAGASAAGALQGNQSQQLIATGQWISGVLAVIGATVGLVWVMRRVGVDKSLQVIGVVVVLLLAVATFRTAWRWNFLHADYVNEHGVYAHGGPGVKIALRQIEEIAERTGGKSALKIAYDSDSSWPFTWYMRDYPSQAFFGSTPSREALDAPVIVAGSASWATVEQILGKRYDQFTYRLIWWPMEDYKVFTDCPLQETVAGGQLVRLAAYDENDDGRIDEAEQARGEARCRPYVVRNSLRILGEWLGDAAHRQALWDVFWNRDYTRYDQITGKTHTPDRWPLIHDFKLYVRKDVAAQVWDLGVGPVVAREPVVDPYAKGRRELVAIQVIGSEGNAAGQFSAPHGLAVGPDGSLYVADSNNHRIQKFSPQGEFVTSFGGQAAGESVPPGALNEPWGVAVAPDGSAVYVANTWSHTIDKFSPDGEFITRWGQAGQTDGTIRDDPSNYYILWGPRGIAVNDKGEVFVTDTGDKRIIVYDSSGKYLRQFGGKGFAPGQLDEPVGIAVDPASGNLVVADTWNQRVQVLDPQTGLALRTWAIDGWTGQSVTNKPYLAVGPNGYVYVTDPTGFRVLVFTLDGTFIATFGDLGADNKGFQLPIGIAVDADGDIYVGDAGPPGRVLKFLPLDLAIEGQPGQ